MHRLTKTVFALTTLIFTVASAYAETREHIKISGFGNLSAIHSGTENLGFTYDLTKEGVFDEWSWKKGSAIGLQLNAGLSEEFDLVVQGVLQDRLDNDLNNSITWAFLRYKLSSPRVSIRLGRIAPPIYMLSEYRNVGFAYLWTKPITDFYANIPVTSLNGGDITYTTPFGEGVIEVKLFGGQSEISINTIDSFNNVKLSPLIGTKLSYDSNDWVLSASASTAKVDNGNPADLLIASTSADPSIFLVWPSLESTLKDFEFENTRFYYYSMGAAYESSDWHLQSELSYTDADWPFFPDLISGYASVGKTVDALTFYGFASKAKSVGTFYALQAPDPQFLLNPQINGVYQLIQQNLDARVIDQETFGIGMRYYIGPQISLKGQIERTWLNDDRFGAWSINKQGLSAPVPDHIDSVSISLSFVF